MFDFLRPRHVRQGRVFAKDARKLLAYKRDLWSEAAVADFEKEIARLDGACKAGDKREIEESAATLDKKFGALVPPATDSGLRENCEVFLVAIVIALGVRTYFLQPFTIPTGSMQPTLNGIRVYPTTDLPPNFLVRSAHLASFGRTYVNVVAKEECVITGVREFKSLLPFVERTPFFKLGFFNRTEIMTDRGSYVVKEASEPVARHLLKPPGTLHHAGEPIARGYINTGDHVFVDKISYHFRPPRRGEVLVFNTQNLQTIENTNKPGGPSQFYIKRLAGLPGDELRIDAPLLFINGKLAEGRSFERVMSAKDGYEGYGNGAALKFPLLRYPDTPLTLPPKHYFALGDNSYHSSDSRHWGPVPQQNIMGRGVFVYWPFDSHWGLMR